MFRQSLSFQTQTISMREKGSSPKEEGEEYALRLLAMRDHSREEMRRNWTERVFGG